MRSDVAKKNALRFRAGMSLAFGLIWTNAALGNQGVTFSPAVHYATGHGPGSVAIGDLNGDQVADMVMTNWVQRVVGVLLGVGDGTFESVVQYAFDDSPGFVAIGDLDGDLVPDLAVAYRSQTVGGDGVLVLLGVGDGTFAAAVFYALGDSPQHLAIDDLNGDLIPDLAVVDNHPLGGGEGVLVLLGNGDGTFANAVHYNAGSSPEAVAIGDLNGDQVSDLAVADQAGNNANLAQVLLGVGDGTFANAVSYTVDVNPITVAIGDFDGDLVQDLVTASFTNDTVSVLLGVGDGTFFAAASYPLGPGAEAPEYVAIGDLNDDQVPDLAVANLRTDNVSVLLGIGDGTFGAAMQFATGNDEALGVAIGDLDGDQLADLAVANNGANNDNGGVAVLLNRTRGACCNGTACGVVVDRTCLDSGGTFFGQNTNCDSDIDFDGVHDRCDPCRYSNPDDTDGDSVCDSADACPGSDDAIDNDGDTVPDDCDACDNNVPGDCDFVSPIRAGAPHGFLKNRYISIDPRGENALNQGDVPFDIRVRLSSTLVSGVTAIGEWWWANAPDANCISVVGATQPVTPPDWSACPTLHLAGCPIIPTSTYVIVAVAEGLQAGPPLVADTQAKPGVNWHGDCVGNFTGPMGIPPNVWTAPNGTTNADDFTAAIKTFQDPNAPNATHFSVTDMEPFMNGTQINLLVNINDVFAIIRGFQGFEYPGSNLAQCP